MLGTTATGLEGLKVGDRVEFTREPGVLGTIKIVEDNKLSVMVQWDDWEDGDLDFRWANKVRKVFE